MPTDKRGTWLDPLNRMIWHEAFKARKKNVTLRNGKKFKLRYPKHRPGKVWVSPDNGTYVPCGWFDLEEVSNRSWIREGVNDSPNEFLDWLKNGAKENRTFAHLGDIIKFNSDPTTYDDAQLRSVIILWEDEVLVK